ncbi:MAG: pyridoxine 5'-phosphate synthase [Phycisphaerales bacterium]|nr:pyridoxine 5'-phosphate synthase [Phycisphaerales bacterium]
MTQLSVNVNKVATLRNTRPLNIPSVLHCAKLALDAGAHGITVHPRPDHRHIRPDDVTDLAALLKHYPHAEFNIEGNPFLDYMPHIRNIGGSGPTQCTLVPDSTEQFTSDHGWSLTPDTCKQLAPLIVEMKHLGCRVSLFMDASPLDAPASQFEIAKQLGADRIELYTEPYARAFDQGGSALEASLTQYITAAQHAHALGLALNAGHDLNLHNLPLLLQHIPTLAEVSIGHALIADALEFGLPTTVKKYLAAIDSRQTKPSEPQS